MWIGDVVGDRFVIERPVGSGGMGTVFRGSDRRTGARVAVKVIDEISAELEDRFLREARALSEVAHPSVVR
jgi:serine/threonine protein kinase